MTDFTLADVTVEAHRVAEEVVKREIHTATLEMKAVVYEILKEKFGPEHDEDHIWVRVRKKDSDLIRTKSQGWLVTAGLQILVSLVMLGAAVIIYNLINHTPVGG